MEIEIIIAYCRESVLELYIKNDSNINLSDLVNPSVKNRIICIFNELLKISSRFEHIFPQDFSDTARSMLLYSSCSVIEKFLYTSFGADAIVFFGKKHIIAFKSQKDLDFFQSPEGMQKLRERFNQYTDNKDHWNVFSDFTYNPKLCLSSDLNEDQRYGIYRDRN